MDLKVSNWMKQPFPGFASVKRRASYLAKPATAAGTKVPALWGHCYFHDFFLWVYLDWRLHKIIRASYWFIYAITLSRVYFLLWFASGFTHRSHPVFSILSSTFQLALSADGVRYCFSAWLASVALTLFQTVGFRDSQRATIAAAFQRIHSINSFNGWRWILFLLQRRFHHACYALKAKATPSGCRALHLLQPLWHHQL